MKLNFGQCFLLRTNKYFEVYRAKLLPEYTALQKYLGFGTTGLHNVQQFCWTFANCIA